jgi:hypothetical protein
MLHTSARREEGWVEQQQSRWRKQVLWTASVAAAVVFLILVICGYRFGWKWTGLPKQTLWDWLDLLIVPAVLAVGGYLFTRTETQRTVQSAERQQTLDREIATQQANTDRELADERRQDDTLQAYLDGMAQLLTDKDQPLHSAQLGDSLSTVARARTLTVLGRLDSVRKRSVLQFLYESGLIHKEQSLLDEGGLIERRHNIVSLEQADLSGSHLRRAHLFYADLRGANLSGSTLSGADLSGAVPRYATLWGADLSGANLSGADLQGAGLEGADLSNASGITNEDLKRQTFRLTGATMPNGQKYEDWRKDR